MLFIYLKAFTENVGFYRSYVTMDKTISRRPSVLSKFNAVAIAVFDHW